MKIETPCQNSQLSPRGSLYEACPIAKSVKNKELINKENSMRILSKLLGTFFPSYLDEKKRDDLLFQFDINT